MKSRVVTKPPHLIAELANSHAGDIAVLSEIIEAISLVEYPDLGIKFQVFRADRIALPDFEYYETYTSLQFTSKQWANLISTASVHCKVWIDVFDTFGIEILEQNLDVVFGIKLQASILENREVFTKLCRLDMREKKIMLNISGHTESAVNQYLESYKELNSEIILQIGYQSYPTAISDTNLQKIDAIKKAFPNSEISFADHVEGTDEFALEVPVLAYVKGSRYIEKHVCIERSRTTIDLASAVDPREFSDLATRLQRATEASTGPFISETEAEYLRSTIQIPVLAHDLLEGEFVTDSDLVYRRTNQNGLTRSDIEHCRKHRQVLSGPVSCSSTLEKASFRPARVFALVAARMKSSRLKEKATKTLGGTASVERCLEQLLGAPGLEGTILCTSHLESDAVLADYTLGGRAELFMGDPVDVISRFLGACEEYDVDVVVRVTADCPLIPPSIVEHVLESHFETGADYSVPRAAAVGTGVEVMNVSALKRISDHFGNAEHSEYMTWYFKNNPEHFEINFVDLPDDMVRDYRLTLDHAEDREMFDELYKFLPQENRAFDAQEIFDILDSRPEIAKINSHISLKFQTDKDLIELLDRETKI